MFAYLGEGIRRMWLRGQDAILMIENPIFEFCLPQPSVF